MKGDDIKNNFEGNFGEGAQTQGATISQLQSLGLELPETWKITGMAYHGVHYTELSLQFTVQGREISRTMHGEFYGGTISWVIPVVVLLGAGAVVASSQEVRTPREGAIAGAKIAVGYALLVVATTFVFTWATTVSGPAAEVTLKAGPSLVSSLVFAGALYPIALGAIGGAAAVSFSDSPNRTAPQRGRY